MATFTHLGVKQNDFIMCSSLQQVDVSQYRKAKLSHLGSLCYFFNMEYYFHKYNFRLVLNPTDFILRAEHSVEHRVYEGTFRASDFTQYVAIGGLEFVIKVVRESLNGTEGTSIEGIEGTPERLTMSAVCTSALFPKPLVIRLELPSVRRSDAAIGLDTVGRQVKALEERVDELETELGRLRTLEYAFGHIMILPGIPHAIPRNTPQLYLIQQSSAVPVQIDGTPWSQGAHGLAGSDFVSHDFTHQSIYGFTAKDIDLRGLAIAKCTSLCIVSNKITEYSPIQYMESLTELTICGYLNWAGGGAYPFTLYQPAPLKDISWIGRLKNLQVLRLIGCTHLTDSDPRTNLKNLSALKNLKTLDIRLSSGLTNFTSLNPHLTVLKS